MNGRRWFVSDDRLWRDALGLHLREERGEQFAVADFSTVTMRTIERGSLAPREHGFDLSETDAQQIMDELWRAGVRPRNGSGALAHVEAINAHLQDMRKLAKVIK